MELNVDENKLFDKRYEGTHAGWLEQGGNIYSFTMHLRQMEHQIWGEIDDQFGHAMFAGTLKDDRFTFIKKYETGQSTGYEFYYDGALDPSEPGVSGRWEESNNRSNGGSFHISLHS